MSVRVSSRVWADSKQSGDRLLLMLALAEYSDDDGFCWPSQVSLAARTRCSERGVQKMIDALLACGEIVLIKAGGGRGRSAEYHLAIFSKGERGSSFNGNGKGERGSVKGEPGSGFSHQERANVETIKGERGDAKGEPENIKGEQAVPPNRQRTVKEPSEEPSAGSEESEPETVKIPKALNTPAFKTAWTRWLAYRSERRLQKPKAMSADAKFKELAEWGEQTAIAAINQAIANNWQGIFPPRSNGSNGHAPSTRVPAPDAHF